MIQKKVIYSIIICLTIGFVIANYTYQLFTKRDWTKATERSYFQIGLAITICAMIATK